MNHHIERRAAPTPSSQRTAAGGAPSSLVDVMYEGF
jgi:type VI secretion system protein ImpK